jgi:hypothetical protein
VNLSSFEGLIYFFLCLLLFLLVQRWLHRELQAIFLLITRSPKLSLGLFSVIFFPGVLLHEVSHLLMAWVMRVPTKKISLVPQMLPDGNLRMGYVETSASDVVREALIGAAPLFTGGAMVAYIGIYKLRLIPLVDQVFGIEGIVLVNGIRTVTQVDDFWLWFYLAFAISSTMLPSSSDRRAWMPIGVVAFSLAGLALFAGAGPWLINNLASPLDILFRALALIFAASLILHGCLALPAFLLRVFISRVTGLRVV